MIEFYNAETFYDLQHKIKLYKIFYILIAVLFGISEVLLVVFANYYKKGLFMAVASLVAIVLTFLFIYIFDRRKYYLIIYSEFGSLLNEIPEKRKIKVIKSSGKPITLSDSSCVYEIICMYKGKKRSLYLSNIFENVFDEGKSYVILEASDYILGYENED